MMIASRRFLTLVLGLTCAMVVACDDTHGDLGLEPRDAAGNATVADAAAAGGRRRDAGHPRDSGASPLPPSGKLDVLLVVDNSNSMLEEQDALRQAFRELVRALENQPGGLPDLHVGVVSTDVGSGTTPLPGNLVCSGRLGGDRGALVVKAGCGIDRTRARFVALSNGGATRNFAGELEDVVGCLATIGNGGCGFEQPLLATQLALETSVNPESAGFIRDEADLLIVIVSDEDDCSADPNRTELFSAPTSVYPDSVPGLRCAYEGHLRSGQRLPLREPVSAPLSEMSASPGGTGPRDLLPVAAIVDAVKKKKPNRRLMVAAIVGWSTTGGTYAIEHVPFAGQLFLDLKPLCTSKTGAAVPALRIKRFVDAFGPRGRIESLCDPDWPSKLARIGDLVRSAP